MKNSQNTPKIYVGTYGMYNSGSLFGKWFDLSDYADAEEFYKDCYEYHHNEFLSIGDYPELMFQDWENIPAFLISESSLHDDTFRYLAPVCAHLFVCSHCASLRQSGSKPYPDQQKSPDAICQDQIHRDLSQLHQRAGPLRSH